MAFWAARNMGVLFGGVSDTDPDEETLDSVFYNELSVKSSHLESESDSV